MSAPIVVDTGEVDCRSNAEDRLQAAERHAFG